MAPDPIYLIALRKAEKYFETERTQPDPQRRQDTLTKLILGAIDEALLHRKQTQKKTR